MFADGFGHNANFRNGVVHGLGRDIEFPAPILNFVWLLDIDPGPVLRTCFGFGISAPLASGNDRDREMDRRAAANGDLDVPQPPVILAAARNIAMKWKNTIIPGTTRFRFRVSVKSRANHEPKPAAKCAARQK